MSLEEQNTEKERKPTPYTEKIHDPPKRDPPIQYIPVKPLEFFEKYRDGITKNVRKVWPRVQDDYVLQPFQSIFRYYEYGGQYNFICELADGQPTYITVTEPFEKEDGELANDDIERRRRVIISAS